MVFIKSKSIIVLAVSSLVCALELASATTSVWTGSVNNSWTNAANWTGGVPDHTVFGNTAVFDTTGGVSYYVNNIPASNNRINFDISGDGFVQLNSTTTSSWYIRGDFEVTGSVDLNVIDYFYPSGAGNYEILWNSTGTFTTVDHVFGTYWNTANSTWRQQAGLVTMNGTNFFRRNNCHYYLEGGTLQTDHLWANEGVAGCSIDISGGRLHQQASMRFRNADVLLSDGQFDVDGTITNFGSGELMFTAASTGVFTSQHTQADLTGVDGWITTGKITKDAADTFYFLDNGDGTTSVSLFVIPEPSSCTFIALALIGFTLRRKRCQP